MFYIVRCPKEILPLKKGTVVICKTPHFTLSNHLTLFTGKKKWIQIKPRLKSEQVCLE